MTYRQYVEQTPFVNVWAILQKQYGEDEGVKESYSDLYEELKKLPEGDNVRPILISGVHKHTITRDTKLPHLRADNVLYRQEDLIDQRVEIEEGLDVPPAEVVALILYSSTMYGFKTGRQVDEDFSAWLKGLMEESLENRYPDPTPRDIAENESLEKKKQWFWQDAINRDFAYNWQTNLGILEKKLRYNIGYNQYKQRFDRWRYVVQKMELCCSLLKIAACDDYSETYVNCKNAARFGVRIKCDRVPESAFYSTEKAGFRQLKAYHLVFKFMEKNGTAPNFRGKINRKCGIHGT